MSLWGEEVPEVALDLMQGFCGVVELDGLEWMLWRGYTAILCEEYSVRCLVVRIVLDQRAATDYSPRVFTIPPALSLIRPLVFGVVVCFLSFSFIV